MGRRVKAENAELKARIAEQDAKIAAPTKQVELLTKLLNRNSKNAHLPPSSDGPGDGAAADIERLSGSCADILMHRVSHCSKSETRNSGSHPGRLTN